MSKPNEYDSNEEIEEDIKTDNCNGNEDNYNEFTYDKFLLESVIMPNQQKSEWQLLQNNKMKEIISDIRQRETETQKSKEDKKRKMLQDLSKKFNMSQTKQEAMTSQPSKNSKKKEIENEDHLCNIDQALLINQANQVESNNKLSYNNCNDANNNHAKLVPDLNESNEELYHINFEEFTQENTKDYMTVDEVYVNRSNNNLNPHKQPNSNEIKYPENQLIVNQNDTVYNNNITNNANNLSKYNDNDTMSYENNLNVQDLSSFSNMNNTNDIILNNNKYAYHNQKDKQKIIEENYNCIIQQGKKNSSIINQYDKYNNKYSNNNSKPQDEVNLNQRLDQRLIVVENYTNEEDMKIKEEKLKRLREKKIKEQEQKKQMQKGGIMQRPSTVSSNHSKRQMLKVNNNRNNNANHPVVIMSDNNNSKYTNQSNKNLNSNVTNISKQSHNNNSNKAKQRPSTAGINSTSTTSGNESLMSRVPVIIQREESLLANKKIKSTVKCSKMSNKKMIKKAINEVCLAGKPNRECREKIIEVIDRCECENYIILFKGNYGRFDLKGVYTFDPSNEQIELLTCLNNAPNFIDSTMVSSYFKYDSSQNKFKELPGNKDFSVIVDGINIK